MRKTIIVTLILIPWLAFAGENTCTDASGNFTAPSCNTSGYLNTDVKDITPGTGATDLGKAEDAAHTSGDTGVAIWGVRNDNQATNFCGANGDYCPVQVSGKGALVTTIELGAALTSSENILSAEDSASGDGYAVVMSGAIRDDALEANTAVGTDLDKTWFRVDNFGALWTHDTVKTTTLTDTGTIEAAAYAAGDCIMASAEALTGTAATAPFLTGRITDIVITDLAAQAANIDVVFFNADPGAICAAINNAADIADDDLAKVVGIIPVTTHFALNDNSVSTATNVNIKYSLASGTALYYALIARGTPTYASVSDLVISVKVELD